VLVPATALALPLFLIFSKVEATNTFWSVFLPSLVNPFGVYLARIYATASVPDELLEAARIDAAPLHLEQERVDLANVVAESWEAVEPAAGAKQIESCIEIDPAVRTLPFRADGPRLQQVITNLFANAVKFTPAGGRVSARVRRADAGVEIVVSDTGRGIPPEFLPFVFEPFRQAAGGPTGPEAGFGLGLSIAKHLVEAHGGEIRAASDGENRGATFTVRLPLTPALVDTSLPSRAAS
jgi:signal transduction histidine kinase